MASSSLLLLLSSLLSSSVSGEQCSTSSDCLTPDAPYCSRWGWCQWTAQYGEGGPSQWDLEDVPPGSCRSAQDCTPRAPVCSNQGFCTVRQSHEQRPDNPSDRVRSQTVSSQRARDQIINPPRNNNQPYQISEAASSSTHRASRTQEQFLKSQTNHLNSNYEEQSVTNNFKRSSGHGNHNHNNNNQIKQKPTKQILEPNPARPDQTTKSSRNLPQLFETFNATPVTGIQRKVLRKTTRTSTIPPPEYYDRISTDYYDYYDYNYYTEFEVMKMDVLPPPVTKSPIKEHSRPFSAHTSNGGSGGGQVQSPHRAVPQVSVSQGCLVDCVSDCVAIQQLTAYRDCVEFCGRRCNDKK